MTNCHAIEFDEPCMRRNMIKNNGRKTEAQAYLDPETNVVLKVEKVNHNSYVVNFESGPERMKRKDIETNLKYEGPWNSHIANQSKLNT